MRSAKNAWRFASAPPYSSMVCCSHDGQLLPTFRKIQLGREDARATTQHHNINPPKFG